VARFKDLDPDKERLTTHRHLKHDKEPKTSSSVGGHKPNRQQANALCIINVFLNGKQINAVEI